MNRSLKNAVLAAILATFLFLSHSAKANLIFPNTLIGAYNGLVSESNETTPTLKFRLQIKQGNVSYLMHFPDGETIDFYFDSDNFDDRPYAGTQHRGKPNPVSGRASSDSAEGYGSVAIAQKSFSYSFGMTTATPSEHEYRLIGHFERRGNIITGTLQTINDGKTFIRNFKCKKDNKVHYPLN